MSCRRRNDCRFCGGTALTCFVQLGEQPPSNSFLRPGQLAAERAYPLDVFRCTDCGLVQLLDVVDPELIFSDYDYLSSTSRALCRHYAELTETLACRLPLRPGNVVVDIGCNDGIMLNAYSRDDLTTIGIEPSQVAALASSCGHVVYNDFFSPDLAQTIRREQGAAAAVTATNVFAHVDDIGAFTAGIRTVLADDGLFVIEAPYLIDMLEQTLFDTIYHEHLCYLSLNPLLRFLAACGLQVIDVERVAIGASGPALRVWSQLAGGPRQRCGSVQALLDFERAWGLADDARYTAFSARIAEIRRQLLRLLRDLRQSGKRVGGYGAPAKGNVLLNSCGIDAQLLTVIAETNTLKQGCLTPGSHIPIVSEDEFLADPPDVALLLAWNYLPFFLEHSPYIRQGGRFLVPLPQPRLVP